MTPRPDAGPRVSVYTRRTLTGRKQWAWRFIAANGQVVATDGGQGYENRADAIAAAELVTGRLVPVVDGLYIVGGRGY